MSAGIVRLPTALRDLDGVADYLRLQGGPDRAIRFLRAAEATFTRLARMPGLGARYEPIEPIYAGLRFSPIDRHPKFLVFYRPIAGGIEVYRVLHGARDIPGILAGDFDIGEDDPAE